jgi:3-oxoadipate enol-lactonase
MGGSAEEVQLDGARLLVRRVGSGPGPLWVLVHGLANTSIAWLPLTLTLRRRRRLALPELTELGGSEVPGGAFGIDEGVAALESWLERRRAEGDDSPVFLIGVSLGGWIACRLALRRPDLVQTLALVNAAGYREQDWDAIAALIRPQNRAEIRRLADAMFLRRRQAIGWLEPALLRVFTRPPVRGVLEGIREEQALEDHDLARLAVPTLLVWGDRDGLFRVDVGKRMAERIPGANFVTLSGAAHAVTWERPGALAAQLEEFVDRHSQGAESAGA